MDILILSLVLVKSYMSLPNFKFKLVKLPKIEILLWYRHPIFFIEYLTQNVIFHVKSHVTNMSFEDY